MKKVLASVLATALLSGMSTLALKAQTYSGRQPTVAGIQYGPHTENVMDLWLVRRGGTTPVVFFFHGGAFRAGSRFGIKEARNDLREPLLAAGISVVSVDYRLDPQLALPEKLADIARSIQWLRHHASEYNIDKERVAAYGSSAGCGASFWLATHDDMAIPDSPDPVLRESTRLLAVGGLNVQATYDVKQWVHLLDIPQSVIEDKYGARLREMSPEEYQAMRKDYDMLAMLDAGDPPMHFQNDENPPEYLLGHYPGHLVAIKEKADRLGLECIVGDLHDRGSFFIRHLKAPAEQTLIKESGNGTQ